MKNPRNDDFADITGVTDIIRPETPSTGNCLGDVRAAIGDGCTRCPLHEGRSKIVFGEGDPNARLMFIGEGPGAEEDRQGRPFVGRAGQLLTKMIEAMGFAREDVFIANIVKCRPPQNRAPFRDEIDSCVGFLHQQIDCVKPEIIVALGSVAVQALLDTTTGISRLRGRFHDYRGIKMMPTFHPAYLLRNPAMKKPTWEDLQTVMKELGLKVPQDGK